MAVVHGPIQGRLPAGTRGLFYFRSWRGLIVAQSCPTYRRHRRAPRLLETIEAFRARVLAEKYADPELQAALMDATRGTVLLWRDMLHAMNAGTLVGAPIVNGRRLYPLQFAEKVRRALNTLYPRAPGILVRHAHRWQTMRPGPAGTVLTSRGPNALPEWT